MIEIRIKRGGKARSILVDQDEVVIGRRNDKMEVHVDLSLDDSVSRIHARVWAENGIMYLEDLESSGGTYIDGSAIDSAVSLEPDTEVVIGDHCLCFCLDQSTSVDGEGVMDGSKKSNSPKCVEPGIHVEMTIGARTNRSVFNLEELYVGREHPEHEIHIDLSSDLKASRVHARIWRTREICWVEDLSSTHGTKVNGEVLDGARVIGSKDVVTIGDTHLLFHYEAGQSDKDKDSTNYETSKLPSGRSEPESAFEEMDSYPVYKEDSYRYFPPGNRKKLDLEGVFQSRKSPMGRIRVTHEISLTTPFQDGTEGLSDFLGLLPDMITKTNQDLDSRMISDWVVHSVSKWVSGAERASVYAIDKDADRIRLLAHKPALKPIISDVLVHRALEERFAFAWQQVDKSESVRRISANAGIYVPLFALGEEVGVICVEDTRPEADFSLGHLSRLVVVGHLISLPLLHHKQNDDHFAAK